MKHSQIIAAMIGIIEDALECDGEYTDQRIIETYCCTQDMVPQTNVQLLQLLRTAERRIEVH